MSETRAVSARLTEDEIDFVVGQGHGNFSAGIRALIRKAGAQAQAPRDGRTMAQRNPTAALLAPAPQPVKKSTMGYVGKKPGGLKSISSPTGPVTKTFRRG